MTHVIGCIELAVFRTFNEVGVNVALQFFLIPSRIPRVVDLEVTQGEHQVGSAHAMADRPQS